MAEHPDPFDSWSNMDDVQLDAPDPAEIRRRGDRRRTTRRTAIGSVTAAFVLLAAGVAFGLSGASTLPTPPEPAQTPSLAPTTPSDPNPSPTNEQRQSPSPSIAPLTSNNLIWPAEMFSWQTESDDWQWSNGAPYQGEGQFPPFHCQMEEFGGRDVWVGSMTVNGTEAFTEAVVQFGSAAEAAAAKERYMGWAANCTETLRNQHGLEVTRLDDPISVQMNDTTFPQVYQFVIPTTMTGDDAGGRPTYLAYAFIDRGTRVMIMSYWTQLDYDPYVGGNQPHPIYDLVTMAWSTIER